MKGIKVSRPVVTVDHWELGRAAWEWSDLEQADFFHGLAIAAQESPAIEQHQWQAIADVINNNPAYSDAAEFIKELADRLEGKQ